MEIKKSSRHAKITGDFAEHLVLYWLSKYGFECARIDHTGIDLIARNPDDDLPMGVSVKSRCRLPGQEESSVLIPMIGIRKAEEACSAFRCTPHFAIVVDAGEWINGILVPLPTMLQFFPNANRTINWGMSQHWLKKYSQNPNIKRFAFHSETQHWWGNPTAASSKLVPAGPAKR